MVTTQLTEPAVEPLGVESLDQMLELYSSPDSQLKFLSDLYHSRYISPELKTEIVDRILSTNDTSGYRKNIIEYELRAAKETDLERYQDLAHLLVKDDIRRSAWTNITHYEDQVMISYALAESLDSENLDFLTAACDLAEQREPERLDTVLKQCYNVYTAVHQKRTTGAVTLQEVLWLAETAPKIGKRSEAVYHYLDADRISFRSRDYDASHLKKAFDLTDQHNLMGSRQVVAEVIFSAYLPGRVEDGLQHLFSGPKYHHHDSLLYAKAAWVLKKEILAADVLLNQARNPKSHLKSRRINILGMVEALVELGLKEQAKTFLETAESQTNDPSFSNLSRARAYYLTGDEETAIDILGKMDKLKVTGLTADDPLIRLAVEGTLRSQQYDSAQILANKIGDQALIDNIKRIRGAVDIFYQVELRQEREDQRQAARDAESEARAQRHEKDDDFLSP